MSEYPEANASQPPTEDEAALRQQVTHVSQPLSSASEWMKFLAVISVIAAIITLFSSLWYLLVVWLPVWLAVLLWKAASAVRSAWDSGNAGQLREALDRLRLYFKISGILALISLVFGLISLFVAVPYYG
jgi:type IV secretory pathway VirB2 component (pilin)